MRLAKFIARTGLASRREAEKLILAGKVKVNNKPVIELVTFIEEGDQVELDGKNLMEIEEPLLYKFYKPKEVIVSRRDPQGRVTLFDLLPKKHKNLITVGRLDYKTEGLILLTNKGEIARYFELPKNNIKRSYRVRVFGDELVEGQLNKIKSGIEVAGIKYRPIQIRYEGNKWYSMTLSEGKNREIRKIFEFFSCQVSKLIRKSYGSYQLDDMKPGELIPVLDIPSL
jgi:23S rRNA pseudouridine2605 synthase